MKYLSLIAATFITLMSLVSCEDSSPIGESLIENTVNIVIDSTFTVTGHSVESGAVQSRTVMQLLGRIDAEGYGKISSDVVTQFISAERLDTTGVTTASIDSVKLVLAMAHGGFTGDSLVPMGIDVYRLNKALPAPIYSDFDPSSYYSPNDRLASSLYIASSVSMPKSDEYYDDKYLYYNVKLPLSFGQELFDRYKQSPETFSSPQAFTKWFPGLYIKNSFGSGRIVNISSTTVRLFFHRTVKITGTDRDTTVNATGTYLAVSPEVITNNNISYTIAPSLRQRAQDGEAIIAAPAGLDAEFRFPAREIIAKYRSTNNPLSVINELTFSLPADYITNDYGIAPPQYLLMVKKSRRKSFFENADLNDSQHAFYATYNAARHTYEFGSMRNYIITLLNQETISDEDVDFVITPVSISFETNSNSWTGQSSTTVSSIVPYVLGPAMCRLRFEDAKIKFTYSQKKI